MSLVTKLLKYKAKPRQLDERDILQLIRLALTWNRQSAKVMAYVYWSPLLLVIPWRSIEAPQNGAKQFKNDGSALQAVALKVIAFSTLLNFNPLLLND